MAQAQKKPPTLPGHVQHIIITPLYENNNVGLFLSNLGDYISSGYVPSTEFIQILIYLVLSPPLEPPRPEPIYLLHRILACHSPAHFAHSIPGPLKPGDAEPGWKAWHPDANHAVGRQTVKMMVRCKEGIWDLLWRPRADDEERRVGDGAWEVLGWLVELWEKDQEEYGVLHPDEQGYSPMFISQLSGPSADLVPDNASALLDITSSAFSESDSRIGQHERIDLAARLFALLNDATLHRPPLFHPPSLVLSFLTLLRSTLGPKETSTFLTYLQPKVPPWVLAHVYAITIEDLAGVRVARAAQRRRAKGQGEAVPDFDPDIRYSPFPPPSIVFLLSDLLLLEPGEGKETRMGIVKLALTGLMMVLHSPTPDDWTGAIEGMDADWMDKIKAVGLSTQGTDKANGMALVALLQGLYPRHPPSTPPPLPTSPPNSQRPASGSHVVQGTTGRRRGATNRP